MNCVLCDSPIKNVLEYSLNASRQAGQSTGTTLQFTEEFHNRLKFNVKKLTCHINRDRIQFEKMLNGYNEDEAKTLCRVLYLEMLQVIKAVEEAK